MAGTARVAVRTGLAAAVSAGSAVLINLATGDQATGWVWTAVVLLTVAAGALNFWGEISAERAPGPVRVDQKVEHSVISGSIAQIGRAGRVVIPRRRR